MLVGGCIRDSIVGKKIADYDLATKYRPDQLTAILDKHGIEYLNTGKKFGTITAILGDKKFEITTLRRDLAPDGRHAMVEFTEDYREDAERRDFTFNALYCGPSLEVWDYFNGIRDLKKGLLRFIGDPEKRILEDHLRILRFFRFYSGYCYFMDYRALAACKKHRDKIKKLSGERITEEMRKLLESNYPLKSLKTMERCGILQKIFDYKGKLDFNALEIFYSLKFHLNFDYNYLFVLALLKNKNTLECNLKLTRKEKNYLDLILKNIPENLESPGEMKKLLFELGDAALTKTVAMISLCSNFTPSYGECLDVLEKTKIPEFRLGGEDLLEHGFTNKREYGKFIKMARDIFIKYDFKLNREEIIEILKTKV
jgi:poly(A) polymerase